jgi:glyoxylase-like metal-dependent hydrolase (beta-lactamase superfamily II)
MKKAFLFLLGILSGSFGLQAQSPDYKVYAIRFASSAHPASVSVFADSGPSTDSVTMVFSIWLIKGDNGKNILVDAGFLNGPQAKYFDLANYIRPDSALMKLGLKPEDITDIILSHPHWDHIDGVGLFPNAHLWIQKEDYNYFVGASWASDSTSVYDKQDVRTMVELNMAHRVTLVDGDNKEIIPRHLKNAWRIIQNSVDT